MNRWSCGIWGRPHVQTSYWGIPDCTFVEPPWYIYIYMSLNVFRPFLVRNIPHSLNWQSPPGASWESWGSQTTSNNRGNVRKNIGMPTTKSKVSWPKKKWNITGGSWKFYGIEPTWTNRTCQWGIQWGNKETWWELNRKGAFTIHRQTCQLRRIKCWLIRWLLSHK